MPITIPLIKKTAEYVRQKLVHDPGGQDWHHTERVWRMAVQLQALEGGNLRLIELAALLHDMGDYKRYEFNERKGSLVLKGMMDILDIDEETQKQLIEIIREAKYIGEDTKPPSTIEGKIIQDADWLDSLGAIGIARTFAMGATLQRPVHDPKRRPRPRLNKEIYQLRKKDGTSLNYFYEKTLRLPQLMNTRTAKFIATRRVKIVEAFIKEFMAEWGGER